MRGLNTPPPNWLRNAATLLDWIRLGNTKLGSASPGAGSADLPWEYA